MYTFYPNFQYIRVYIQIIKYCNHYADIYKLQDLTIKINMKYFDSHTHLNDLKLYDNWKVLLKEFENIWWKWLIIWWVDPMRNERAINICTNHTTNVDVKCCLWYHPSELCEHKILESEFKSYISNLKNNIIQNKDFTIWIWECWIDMHYENSAETLIQQIEMLALQADLAQELNLPLVIHSRDGFEPTMNILSNYKNLKIYFHCFGYGPEQLKIIDNTFNNYYIWFAGNATYPKAILLKETAKIVDHQRILIETDAPYLAPQKLRWTTNHPHNIIYIYEYLSNLLWIEIEKFNQIIENNYTNFIN